MKRKFHWLACTAVFVPVTAVVPLRATATDPCPPGFTNEPVDVFSTAARSRMTQGKMKDGRVCVDVKKPAAGSGGTCGWYDSEIPSVFAGAHLVRLTGGGSYILGGRTCVATDRPGSTVFDPIDTDAASKTFAAHLYAEYADNASGGTYRTIENTSAVGCQGQCQIRSKCTAFMFDTETRRCELRTSWQRVPAFSATKRSGVKFPKSNVETLTPPRAALRFSRQLGTLGIGTPAKTEVIRTEEECAKECLLTNGCRAFNLALTDQRPCRLFNSVPNTNPSPANYPQSSFIFGRRF